MQTNKDSAQNSFRSGLEFRSSTPAPYCIQVIGELDESNLDHLRGLEISTSSQGKKPMTTLTGTLPDQTAFVQLTPRALRYAPVAAFYRVLRLLKAQGAQFATFY